MKKRYMVIMAITLVLTLVMAGKGTSLAGERDQLPAMAEVLLKNNVAIDEWSLYARESIPTDSVEKTAQKIMKQVEHFSWEIHPEGESWKAVGTSNQTGAWKKEKIQIISTPKKGKAQAYILYELKGYGWDPKKWEVYSSSFEQTKQDIFHGKPTFFSCIKGKNSVKMEGVLYNQAEKLLNDFEAEPIEKLEEESFISVSAYTGQWKNALPAKNGKMNIQIAIRNAGMGDPATIVVGTPIITTEY